MDYISQDIGSWNFERWHHATCRTFSQTECTSACAPGFSGHVDGKNVGSVTISAIGTTYVDGELRIARGGSDIRKDPRDDLMLYVVSKGSIGLAQSSHSIVLEAGDMALYDQTKPFQLFFFGSTEGKIVAIPRHELLSRLPEALVGVGRAIPGRTNLPMLTCSMVGEIMEWGDQAGSSVAERLAASTLDVIAATLESEFGEAIVSAWRDPRLEKAKRFLRDHLHEQELSLEAVSQAVGVTARTLNRLFLSEGTTPIRWLWKQRLIESRRMLESNKNVHVTEVAFRHGFRDLSHFSRVFKKEFGRSPSAVIKILRK